MGLNEQARSNMDRWLADRNSRDALRAEAAEIVTRHLGELGETFAGMSTEQIVHYTSLARADGDQDAVARAHVWVLGAMPQQHISGGTR